MTLERLPLISAKSKKGKTLTGSVPKEILQDSVLSSLWERVRRRERGEIGETV